MELKDEQTGTVQNFCQATELLPYEVEQGVTGSFQPSLTRKGPYISQQGVIGKGFLNDSSNYQK